MDDDSIPTLKVLITPQYDKNDQATSLHVCLTIQSPALRENSRLVTFPDNFAGVRPQHLLEASDQSGRLLVAFENPEQSEKPLERSWVTLRDTIGDVEIQYEVSTSSKDQFKSGGPVLGLHSEQGGLLGSGFAIASTPPLNVVYRNIVEWDLDQVPTGTRGVWTYGEGPGPVERVGLASILRDSVYMVGFIQSGINSLQPDLYGYYWFGSLPPNIEIIKETHPEVFLKAQKYFVTEDDSEDNEDFNHAFFAKVPKGRQCLTEAWPRRSFVRNTGSTRSFGGTSFQHSHIFNYDDQIGKVHEYDLMRRVAYEMAHIWLGPPAVDHNIDWLYEGIRDYLSIYMPLNNLREPSAKRYFRRYSESTLDVLCTRYYTSPLINAPLREVLKLANTDAYAREHVSARAWAFVMGVDLRMIQIANGELKTISPLEDIVLFPLANEQATGKAHGIKQLVELLTPIMGNKMQQRFEDCCNGSTILLPETLFGDPRQYLKQVDDCSLDFGMDRESFTEGVVRGLTVGTRAEIAGFKNGNKIIRSSHEWRSVDDSDQTMELLVERNGIRSRVKYLPRHFDMVKSWQLYTRTDDEVKGHDKFLREEEKKKQGSKVKLTITTRSGKGRK